MKVEVVEEFEEWEEKTRGEDEPNNTELEEEDWDGLREGKLKEFLEKEEGVNEGWNDKFVEVEGVVEEEGGVAEVNLKGAAEGAEEEEELEEVKVNRPEGGSEGEEAVAEELNLKEAVDGAQ